MARLADTRSRASFLADVALARVGDLSVANALVELLEREEPVAQLGAAVFTPCLIEDDYDAEGVGCPNLQPDNR